MKYKYFSDTEVSKWKLKPELWTMLDKARGLANTPFVITSGYRTVKQNSEVGGVPNSAHTKGLAVDIVCIDNEKRTMAIQGILGCGVPVFLEIAQRHIHIDIDSSIHRLGQTIISPDL